MDILIDEGLYELDPFSRDIENRYIEAVRKGRVDVVHHYIQRGVYVNVRDDYDFTPLITAVLESETKDGQEAFHQIIEIILDNKPHIEAIDGDTQSALMMAVHIRNEVVVKLIIDKFPDAMFQREKRSFTSLMIASAMGSWNIAVLLIDKDKSSVNDLDRLGCNSLLIAAMNGRLKTVHVLLEYGGLGQLKVTDVFGRSALILAAEFGHCELVEYLMVFRSMDVNKTDDEGKTCLMKAAGFGHSKVVKYLLAKKAGIGRLSLNGRTSLMYAAMNGRSNIAKRLAQVENINAIDELGYTALYYAIYTQHLNVVNTLLQNDAVVDVKSLIIAAMSGNYKIFQLLESRIAHHEVDFDLLCKYFHLMNKEEDNQFCRFFKKKVTKNKFGKSLFVFRSPIL